MPEPRYVRSQPEQWSFEKVGIKGKIFDTSDLTNRTQHFIAETESGHETEIVEYECDFVYYVLEGQGEFIVDGLSQSCGAGDLVVIPAGTRFTYNGKLKLLVSSTPPWWEEQEQTL